MTDFWNQRRHFCSKSGMKSGTKSGLGIGFEIKECKDGTEKGIELGGAWHGCDCE